MSRAVKTLAVFFTGMCITVAGCGMVWDTDRALWKANRLMRVLYFDRDYEGACELCDAEFRRNITPMELEEFVEKMDRGAGRLVSVRPVSYYFVKEQFNAIGIFYEGKNEKGITYHQILVAGNKRDGYKVIGIHRSEEPYNNQDTAIKFKKTASFRS